MTELTSLSLRQFTSALASDAPAPGGGSASAAAGASGAGLLGMVVRLTVGKEKYKDVWAELQKALPAVDAARERLLELVDEDTRSYEAVVAARRLPKGTDVENAARQKAIDDATVVATATPMQTAFFAQQALGLAPAIAERGNPNALSDAYVAALLLWTAVEGALANVRINLPGITDRALARGFREDAESFERKGREALQSVRDTARSRTLVS